MVDLIDWAYSQSVTGIEEGMGRGSYNTTLCLPISLLTAFDLPIGYAIRDKVQQTRRLNYEDQHAPLMERVGNPSNFTIVSPRVLLDDQTFHLTFQHLPGVRKIKPA